MNYLIPLPISVYLLAPRFPPKISHLLPRASFFSTGLLFKFLYPSQIFLVYRIKRDSCGFLLPPPKFSEITMVATVTIPRLLHEGSVWDGYPVVGKPGWFRIVDSSGKVLKPLIRCNCGSVSGIGLHHVYKDGSVTNSFYHKKGNVYPEDKNGCEWHVMLKLADWTGEDIPPDPK